MAELKIASQRLDAICDDIKIVLIENIRYLSFTTSEEMGDLDLQLLSRLSFVFALFKEECFETKACLLPIPKYEFEYVDAKIGSLQKYSGKTNELFTKMMINVALLSSDFDYQNKIQLLDPLAGKGTTLFEGIVYGFDVSGVEIDDKSSHASSVFFKKYLETEHIKHTSVTRRIYGKSKSDAIYVREFEYARNKEEFKAGTLRKKLGLVTGRAQDVSKYFGKEKFHILVGDLPYGVGHGNHLEKKSASVTRNPSDLLGQCLPNWHQALKKGGTVLVAWNSFVVSKQKIRSLFRENGFEVFADAPYDDFEHMVDKSIKRDIVVAKKL